MRKTLNIVFFILSALGASPSYALRLDTVTNLDFGTVVKAGQTGTVSVSTNGATIPSGLSLVGSGINATVELVRVSVTKNVNIQSVSALSSTAILTNETGQQITVSNFQFSQTKGQMKKDSYSFSTDLGALATVPMTALPGTYTGTIAVRMKSNQSILDTTVLITLKINPRLEVNNMETLNFGVIGLLNDSAGRVRLNPSNNIRTVVSGSLSLEPSAPVAQAGQFNILGEMNTPVIIVLPTQAVLRKEGGSETMLVDRFSRFPLETMPVLDSNGQMNLYVGADLSISSNQDAGVYTGVYTILVSY